LPVVQTAKETDTCGGKHAATSAVKANGAYTAVALGGLHERPRLAIQSEFYSESPLFLFFM